MEMIIVGRKVIPCKDFFLKNKSARKLSSIKINPKPKFEKKSFNNLVGKEKTTNFWKPMLFIAMVE